MTCTKDEMDEAVRGYIACDCVNMSPDNMVTVSGQVRFPLSSTDIFDLCIGLQNSGGAK